MICVKCGNILSGSKFCKICGHKMGTKPKYMASMFCKECGVENNINSNFCKKCGGNFDFKSSEKEEPPDNESKSEVNILENENKSPEDTSMKYHQSENIAQEINPPTKSYIWVWAVVVIILVILFFIGFQERIGPTCRTYIVEEVGCDSDPDCTCIKKALWGMAWCNSCECTRCVGD